MSLFRGKLWNESQKSEGHPRAICFACKYWSGQVGDKPTDLVCAVNTPKPTQEELEWMRFQIASTYHDCPDFELVYPHDDCPDFERIRNNERIGYFQQCPLLHTASDLIDAGLIVCLSIGE